MASFDLAIPIVLAHEGGYSFDPRDPGGETKYGISKRQYPELDIKNLTLEQAKAIYKRDYWQYDALLDQDVATKVFDAAVNLGTARAVRILQEAVNAVGPTRIAVDGVFGPITAAAANGCNPRALLQEIRARLAVEYAQLAASNPSLRAFLLGWMRRAVNGIDHVAGR
jgi:lysozyme family protein